MSDHQLIGPWIRHFLLEHVVAERRLAANTQSSYRDTLSLLLPYAAKQTGKSIDRLAVDHLSSKIVRSFLLHVEEERGCSISTRNQRLAAIHALARFIGERSPVHVAWCADICVIPFKKADKAVLPYLEKKEMDALLQIPDQKTSQGFRDYALLLFLYNTGARADEAAHVRLADLQSGSSAAVKLFGKGGKSRICPLWPLTQEILGRLTAGRSPEDHVFLNRRRQPITRYGVSALVKRCARQAGQEISSLCAKRVSAHTIRHTTAVHLLRSGVDINTIRAWLGHVSLDTTNVYAEVDLEMKARALDRCEIRSTAVKKHWHENNGIMAFLQALQH